MMQKKFIIASIVAASLVLQSAALATEISIENVGTISGNLTRNVIGNAQERVITEEISENANLNAFPIGSGDAVKGHEVSCDDERVIKLSLTDEIVSGYSGVALPDVNLNDYVIEGEPAQGDPAQSLAHLCDVGEESSWYYQNISTGGSIKIFKDAWGNRVSTYDDAVAFIGNKVTPTAPKSFKGIDSAYISLNFSNINAYDANKFGEVRYLINEKKDKYIAFGLDGNRKAYYSVDGDKTYIPDEYNWPDLDMNVDSKCVNVFSINNVSTNGNKVSFDVTGVLKNNETIKWTGEFEVSDLQDRISSSEWAQSVVTNTCGHQLRVGGGIIKMSYKSEIASQSFAAGFGKSDAAGGESFGLSEEDYAKSNLKFDVKLLKPSLKNNLKIKLGYNPGSSDFAKDGVWADGSLSLPDSVTETEDWQSVSISISDLGGTEAFDWEKVNLIGFSFNEKDDTETSEDERAGSEIQIKNLRLEKEVNCNANVDYIVYDKANNTQLSSLASKGGAEIGVAFSFKNDKDYNEEASYIVALYKDGYMVDVAAIKLDLTSDSKGTSAYPLFALPQDIQGYTLNVFPIKSFKYSKPYAEALVIK